MCCVQKFEHRLFGYELQILCIISACDGDGGVKYSLALLIYLLYFRRTRFVSIVELNGTEHIIYICIYIQHVYIYTTWIFAYNNICIVGMRAYILYGIYETINEKSRWLFDFWRQVCVNFIFDKIRKLIYSREFTI